MAKTYSDGSKPLKSPKHELFAQLHAAGEPECRAYEMAGFASKKGSRASSARLLATANVRGRVDYLLSLRTATIQAETTKAAKNAGIDKEWVMKNLREVAERCMQAVPVFDAKGDRVMVETPDGEVAPAFTFNAKGAVSALVPLGKEIGMFVERKEVLHGQLEGMTDDQLDVLIQQRMEELGLSGEAGKTRH